MGISYDAVSEVLTVDDGTFDFQDIKDADTLGGWGVVTKSGDNQYFLDCYLKVGDGNATTLADDQVQITIGTAATHRWLQVNADATFQLGVLSQGSFDLTYGVWGNSLVVHNTKSGETSYIDSLGDYKLYDCYVQNATDGSIQWRIRGSIDARNMLLNGEGNVFWLCEGTMSRCGISSSDGYGFMLYTEDIELQDIYIDNKYYGMVCGYGSRNPLGRNVTMNRDNRAQVKMHSYAQPQLWRMIDSDYDMYGVLTYSTNYPSKQFEDYKTVKITVHDEAEMPVENAEVSLYGNDSKYWGWWTVPAMTDATHPSGEVTASTAHASYPAYKAFDGAFTTSEDYWQTTAGPPQWIKYKFDSAQVIGRYTIRCRNSPTHYAPKSWELQGSNDDSSWVTLDTVTNDSNLPYRMGFAHYDVDNSNAYQYYRLYITDSHAALIGIAMLQLYSLSRTTDVNGECEDEVLNFICDNNGAGNGTGLAYNDYDVRSPYLLRIKKPGYIPYEGEIDLVRDDFVNGASLTVTLKRLSVSSDQESLP